MEPQLARRLLRTQHLNLTELRAADAALADAVEAEERGARLASFRSKLTDLPPPMRARVERLDAAALAAGTSEARRSRLTAAGIEAGQVDRVLAAADAAGVGQPVAADRAVGHSGTIARVLAGARLDEIARIAGLDARAATAVAQLGSPAALDGDAFAAAIERRELTEAQANDVRLAAALHQLSDERSEIAAAIRAAHPGPVTTGDLAAITADAWLALLGARPEQLDGVSPRRFADVLAARLEDLHPARALVGRLPRPTAANLAAATPAERAAVAAMYPGAGLDGLPADPAARRIEQIHATAAALGDGLFTIDLANADVALPGVEANDRAAVRASLARYQQLWPVAGSAAVAHALLAAGLSSPIAIGILPFAQFATIAGLDAASAEKTWASARGALADVTLTAAALLDVSRQVGKFLGPPGPAHYLKQIAGFEDLFGNLSFCDCEECQSILGPAAYFVDVMKFVDENLRPVFASKPDHVLDLKHRRPDLWTLELTCDNTTDRVPTLELVAEILENFIARRAGFAGSLADRPAIHALVYGQILASRVDSFAQPFQLATARVDRYLAAFGHHRAEIASAIGDDGLARTLGELRLTAAEHQLIVTSGATLAGLSHVYGIGFAGSPDAVTKVDAHALAVATRLDREALGEVLETGFVIGGATAPAITASKLDGDSIQNDVEWVTHLSAANLDRLHRFARLHRRTGWTVPELDLVLTTLGGQDLDAGTVDAVARLHARQRDLGLSVADTCALVGAMPQSPAGASLFDRAFNPPSFVAADGLLPKPTTRFIDPSLRSTTAAPVDPALSRLLSGLRVDLAGLATLSRRLAPHLGQESTPGFDPDAANDADRYYLLSADNLGLLYRHARLARALALSPAQLFELLDLIGRDRVATAADVDAVVELARWRKRARYSFDDLAVATGRAPADPSRYVDPAAAAEQVGAAIAASVEFTDTIFAVALGTTEVASRDLLAANPALVESPGDGRWRLRAGIDLATAPLTLPPSAVVPEVPSGARPVTDDEVRAALAPHEATAAAARALGAVFGFATDKIASLVRLAGLALADAALDLVTALRPLQVVFAARAWDAAALDFVADHPDRFGIGDLSALSIDDLRALSVYQLSVTRTATPPVDPADLRAALLGFDAAAGFGSQVDGPLARVLGVPVGLVVGLRGRIALTAIAAVGLDRVARAAALAAELNLDGETFGAIVSDDVSAISHAADALVAGFGPRFPEEAVRVAKLDEAEQPIREARRDALADHLLHSITPRVWTDIEDLYQYFLIDVSAGGCSTTSRVVSATGAAQLYVYRAMMHLETDNLPAGNPGHVALQLPAQAAAEWEWRQHFRVWQANRKVFLWPENYLVPDLRDDKTPEFRELSDALLQTDLTDQDVLDAYTRYLAQLEELAALRLAGAYHHRVTRGGARDVVADKLHLFGVTASDPPQFYYRTGDTLIGSGRDPSRAAIWSPWQRVPIQTPTRRLSPVVFDSRLQLFWIDIKTKPRNRIQDGASEFIGYLHTFNLKFATLRSDATWTSPQAVALPCGGPHYVAFGGNPPPQSWGFHPGAGQLAESNEAKFDPLDRTHQDAIDDYTLTGASWEWAWPTVTPHRLEIDLRNFSEGVVVDLFRRTSAEITVDVTPAIPKHPYPRLLCARPAGILGNRMLHSGTPSWMFWPEATFANAVIDDRRIDLIDVDYPSVGGQLEEGLYQTPIALIHPTVELYALPGSAQDAIVQEGSDMLLLQGSVRTDGKYVARRLGSTLVDGIARTLFEDGVGGILATAAQLQLAEADLPITPAAGRVVDRVGAGEIDYTGPFGVYYRELYFHIPLLIATALSARGRYRAAQQWFHYLFDPTSAEKIDVTGVPPDEVAHRLLDRVWRYREFRGIEIEHLRDVLADPVALELYKRDPFNPWAIARRRLSGFQKAVVMKYVDNLLDWGDALFAQFTMESVNEAMMIYTMAADVLGPRPTELGDCGAGVDPMTYEQLGPLVDASSEILVEMHTWLLGAHAVAQPAAGGNSMIAAISALPQVVVSHPFDAAAEQPFERVALQTTSPLGGGIGVRAKTVTGGFAGVATTAAAGAATTVAAGAATSIAAAAATTPAAGAAQGFAAWAGAFAWSVIRHLVPVFCVPVNPDLIARWDRLEDRLFKLRHCMDIDGQRRELALFAPPIDPMQLVAMKAAGLSLEDVLGGTSGNLPPYRFAYLIERAKAFAGALAGFGSSMFTAIEKRDAEQLNRVRLTQQINLTRHTSRVRQLEIDTAAEGLDALRRQQASAQYRIDFYDRLLDEDKSSKEKLEGILRMAVYMGMAPKPGMDIAAAAARATPNPGAPTAMTYGGVQVGGMLGEMSAAASSFAHLIELQAGMVAAQGGYERRSEGWEHQKRLAEHEVRALAKSIRAAEIRLDIANRSLELHQQGLDQLDEMLELTDGKFTNLARYQWLAAQMQRLYRGAYQNALALAKLAERAYRFERGEDTLPGLAPTYWDPTHAGLLSGEQLLVDLQALERRYYETNYRALEIDQAFALSQIDAQALLALRETGECVFTVPEVFFDLFYPGHYKRRIRTARITIPCITGPYVNVSATLSLEASWLRPVPTPSGALVEIPPSRSVSVATSTGQNDGGVFELGFRDERYMPFEGLGAVSRWRLTLPRTFRQFDYQTITDIVLSLAYTAQFDGALRERVESDNAALETSIVGYFTSNSARRVLTLRQDFASALGRLARSPAGTAVQLEITDRHLPLVFAGRDLEVTRASLAVRADGDLSGLQLLVDGTPVAGFTPDPTLGDLPSAPLPPAFGPSLRGKHTIAIADPGALAPESPIPGEPSAVDPARLLDVILYLEYRLA